MAWHGMLGTHKCKWHGNLYIVLCPHQSTTQSKSYSGKFTHIATNMNISFVKCVQKVSIVLVYTSHMPFWLNVCPQGNIFWIERRMLNFHRFDRERESASGYTNKHQSNSVLRSIFIYAFEFYTHTKKHYNINNNDDWMDKLHAIHSIYYGVLFARSKSFNFKVRIFIIQIQLWKSLSRIAKLMTLNFWIQPINTLKITIY